MRVVEGRRLTGPNLYLDATGAAVEVTLDAGEDAANVHALWRAHLTDGLHALHLLVETAAPVTTHRPHVGGATLIVAAEIDTLHTTVEVAEWAAAAVADPASLDGAGALDAHLLRLRTLLGTEQNPRKPAWRDRARAEGLPFLWDDDAVSIGFGDHSRTWPTVDLPAPATVDLHAYGAIPVALVTGTNGKTTTARVLARILREAGHRVALTSTDGIQVGDDLVESGDFTGPVAARRALRDPRATAAVLETARGGLLRRGLATDQADAAIVTNAADDHLGEWGIDDAYQMAEAKLIVAKGLHRRGLLVLNLMNAPLVLAAARLGLDRSHRLGWFAVAPWPSVAYAVERGEPVALDNYGRLVIVEGGREMDLGSVADVPITLGGCARHNVENALAAALAAYGMGLEADPIRRGLQGFRPDARDNPGRANLFQCNGATLLVDFAHNPDGLRRLGDVVRKLPARRRLLIVGQAGDRRDADVAALCDEAVKLEFDRYVLKEALHYLRGRALGEMPALLARLLRERGVPERALEHAADEGAALTVSLAWLQPGDLGVLLVHDDFGAALRQLQAAGAVPM
ncbi:MAG: Mur ligase [Myxococcales bacterium]|nr:Mur ligase [Myxococcales bacterium]